MQTPPPTQWMNCSAPTSFSDLRRDASEPIRWSLEGKLVSLWNTWMDGFTGTLQRFGWKHFSTYKIRINGGRLERSALKMWSWWGDCCYGDWGRISLPSWTVPFLSWHTFLLSASCSSTLLWDHIQPGAHNYKAMLKFAMCVFVCDGDWQQQRLIEIQIKCECNKLKAQCAVLYFTSEIAWLATHKLPLGNPLTLGIP